MPALLGYILAVAIFVGGGYGALSWLAGPPEQPSIAAKARHAPRAGTYGAATRQEPQPESATEVSGNAEAAKSPAVSAAPATSATTVAADQDGRHDAMARAEPGAAKPTTAKAAIATAAPESATAPASTTPAAKPEAKPAVAKTAGADRPLRPKQSRVRQAEERRHPRYEVMTLRTIEYPDGHRERRLLPLRERDDALAFRWGE